MSLRRHREHLGFCAKCGVPHQRYRSADHRLFASYCNACHAAYMRATRPAHSELSPEQRMKSNARSYANVLQKRGKLVPEACESCGDERAEKHHDDYRRPADVRWLCRPCHLMEHRESGALQSQCSTTHQVESSNHGIEIVEV